MERNGIRYKENKDKRAFDFSEMSEETADYTYKETVNYSCGSRFRDSLRVACQKDKAEKEIAAHKFEHKRIADTCICREKGGKCAVWAKAEDSYEERHRAAREKAYTADRKDKKVRRTEGAYVITDKHIC